MVSQKVLSICPRSGLPANLCIAKGLIGNRSHTPHPESRRLAYLHAPNGYKYLQENIFRGTNQPNRAVRTRMLRGVEGAPCEDHYPDNLKLTCRLSYFMVCLISAISGYEY